MVASGITHISTMTPPHSSLRTKKDHLKANRLRLATVFFLFFFYLPVATADSAAEVVSPAADKKQTPFAQTQQNVHLLKRP